jgi:hypothetical protein
VALKQMAEYRAREGQKGRPVKDRDLRTLAADLF